MRQPDAPHPRREGEDTDSPGEETQEERTARLVFGRHSRFECMRRSHQPWPCGRCCRHRDRCACPALMSEAA